MYQRNWLTEKEVSEITGISVSTLQKARFYRRGVPYFKIGRSVRYSLTDVQAFMAFHRISFMEEHHA